MSTLDALVQEVIKRTQAAGGQAWIAEDAPTEMKLAFLRALVHSAHRPKNTITSGSSNGIDNGEIQW